MPIKYLYSTYLINLTIDIVHNLLILSVLTVINIYEHL